MPNGNCYTDDWKRTNPDYSVYLQEAPGERDEYSDHIHVFYTPGRRSHVHVDPGFP